jgi:hypothetical protein
MRIPAFIINYNRLTLPKNMAEFISKNENVDVYIIDNNSSYKPLLEWYETCPYNVIHMGGNYGHTVFWEHQLYDKYVKEGPYILTDSDLDLSEIPDDWLEVLIEGLNKYEYNKVGFSLKTEDLPESTFRDEIVGWESQFCVPKARALDALYTEAHIDTTFALHRTDEHAIYSSVRVNYPYTARHIPWYYTDFNVLPDDEKYYFNNLKTSTLWSRQFNQKLNDDNN